MEELDDPLVSDPIHPDAMVEVDEVEVEVEIAVAVVEEEDAPSFRDSHPQWVLLEDQTLKLKQQQQRQHRQS